MKQLAKIALALVLALASLASQAARVDIVGGNFPQFARAYAFFEHTIVVRVTDDAGQPLPGVEVSYSFPPTGESDPFVMNFFENGWPLSDANGLARFELAVDHNVGMINLTFHADDASRRLPPLFAIGGQPVEMKLVSGGDQTAAVGEELDRRWVARAVDRFGFGVPHAVVIFNGNTDWTIPHVTLNGSMLTWQKADHLGYARSPKPVAGPVVGEGQGDVCGFDMGCTQIYFTITE